MCLNPWPPRRLIKSSEGQLLNPRVTARRTDRVIGKLHFQQGEGEGCVVDKRNILTLHFNGKLLSLKFRKNNYILTLSREKVVFPKIFCSP